MITIPVGRDRTPSESADVRSPQQQQAVTTITESDDFDFALSNPFAAEVGDYQGPFTFLWYTKDGTLHGRRISKRGQTLHDVEVGTER